MSFDFTAAVNAAQSVVDGNSSSTNVSYRYPIVYPQKGQSMVIRPLFNPKSNQIIRKINRHEKVPCYRTFGQKCPICEVQQQVKDLTGQDPFGRTSASKTRGLCFAQLVSSTAPLKTGTGQYEKSINPGDIILFMHPWSVYKSINEQIQTISQMPTGMEQGFAHADSGLYIQVSVTNDFKYSVTTVPYMTFNPQNMSDSDFEKMLDGLDDLNMQVVPNEITEEIEKQVAEYSEAIKRDYLNVSEPVGTVVNAEPVSPVAVATQQATTPAVSNKPDCFGKHNPDNTKCVCCPYEMDCSEASNDDDLPF